jgi:hypothetical protein
MVRKGAKSKKHGLCSCPIRESAKAQSAGKEEYMIIDSGLIQTRQELQEQINKLAQEGWKVRAANEFINTNNTETIFVLLYREAQ